MVIAVVALVLVQVLRSDDRTNLDLGDYEQRLGAGEVQTATFLDRSNAVQGDLTDGSSYHVDYPADYASTLTTKVLDAGVEVETDAQQESLWSSLLIQLLPILLLIGAFAWLLSNMGGGAGRPAVRQVEGSTGQPRRARGDLRRRGRLRRGRRGAR